MRLSLGLGSVRLGLRAGVVPRERPDKCSPIGYSIRQSRSANRGGATEEAGTLFGQGRLDLAPTGTRVPANTSRRSTLPADARIFRGIERRRGAESLGACSPMPSGPLLRPRCRRSCPRAACRDRASSPAALEHRRQRHRIQLDAHRMRVQFAEPDLDARMPAGLREPQPDFTQVESAHFSSRLCCQSTICLPTKPSRQRALVLAAAGRYAPRCTAHSAARGEAWR